MKKLLSSQKGEMYVSQVISLVVLISFLGMALTVFQVIGMKDEADRIADVLLENATYNGGFGSEFDECVTKLQAAYFPFEVEYEGDWLNTEYKRVQLGDTLSITVTITANLSGFGFNIPIDIPIHRTGASEKYWK